jgi:hypothetical protein
MSTLRARSFPAHHLAVVLVLFCWLLPGVAAAAQAHLEMDVRTLRVGETAALRLVVAGGSPRGAPALPAVSNLRFTVQRPTTEIHTVNFRTTRITTFHWAVSATAAGEATIGPLQLSVDGQVLKVAPLTLQVQEPTPGDQGPNLLEAGITPSPEGLEPGEAVPLWLGQALVYRFSFSHRDTVYDARWTQPSFDGLEAAPGVEQDSRDYSLQRGGHQYTVHDVDVPLRASKVGSFEIAPSVIQAQFPVERSQQRRRHDPFEEFFGGSLGGSLFAETRTEAFSSNPVPVTIRPLPSEGRPGCFGGLVGSFEVNAELPQRQVKVGDSVTQTITVLGDGVLAGLRLPPTADSEKLRAYDDEPEVKAGLLGGRYRSVATLRRALVPTAEGPAAVPPVELCWFDPAQEAYVVWELPAWSLDVLPGEAEVAPELADFGAPEPGSQDVESLGEDILPIHADVQVSDRRFRPANPLPLALVLLPGLALVLQLGSELRARGGRRSQAKRGIREKLATLPPEGSERLAVLEQCFREAAGLALGIPPAAVSPERLRGGLPEVLAERAAALYRRLESARFAGAGLADPAPEVREVVAQLLGRTR